MKAAARLKAKTSESRWASESSSAVYRLIRAHTDILVLQHSTAHGGRLQKMSLILLYKLPADHQLFDTVLPNRGYPAVAITNWVFSGTVSRNARSRPAHGTNNHRNVEDGMAVLKHALSWELIKQLSPMSVASEAQTRMIFHIKFQLSASRETRPERLDARLPSEGRSAGALIPPPTMLLRS